MLEDLVLKKDTRPVIGGECWILSANVKQTHKFWLCFEKNDINSNKTIILSGINEDPSVVESFLIDEKKTTLKLIISRLLQRFNGQKLLGPN